MHRLPHLRGIQAFVAAAKHMSFKKAADELNVTPTAISHNIKTLEDELGVKLFNRLTRSLTLTNEGRVFAPDASQAFTILHKAVSKLSGIDDAGPLTITTTKSFASTWLAARAHKFRESFPQYSLKIDASDTLKDINANNFDLAIRQGKGDYINEHFVWVLNNFVVPLCSPSLIENRTLPLSPADLLRFPLVVYEWSGFSENDPSWENWFKLSNTPFVDAEMTETYSDEHICLQAASNGRGIALCSLLSASAYLESGTLVIPTSLDYFLPDGAFYMVCDTQQSFSSKITAFQDWLLDEADRYRETEIGALIESAP